MNKKLEQSLEALIAHRHPSVVKILKSHDYGYEADLVEAVVQAYEQTKGSKSKMANRFRTIEYASGYAVQDTYNKKEAWMSDGVDCLFDADGKPISPGTKRFITEMNKNLNSNPEETLEAYFPETVKRRDTQDEKAQTKLLEMLKTPTAAHELPMYYRRHLKTLERAGKIRCDDDNDCRWMIIEKKHSDVKPGCVCSECGRNVTEGEYSAGESSCCGADVIPEEEYGKDGN